MSYGYSPGLGESERASKGAGVRWVEEERAR